MPAVPNRSLADWSPGPQFSGVHEVEFAPDERAFNMYSEQDVAACLMETDPVVEAHRGLLTDDQVEELALESARHIVQQRKDLLMKQQLELARAARTSGRMAVVAGVVENLQTGEITSYVTEVPIGRVFG